MVHLKERERKLKKHVTISQSTKIGRTYLPSKQVTIQSWGEKRYQTFSEQAQDINLTDLILNLCYIVQREWPSWL